MGQLPHQQSKYGVRCNALARSLIADGALYASYLRDDIGMTNRHLSYVYLVDPACRIRWAGCADPMPAEIQALQVCTDVLLKRYSKKA